MFIEQLFTPTIQLNTVVLEKVNTFYVPIYKVMPIFLGTTGLAWSVFQRLHYFWAHSPSHHSLSA